MTQVSVRTSPLPNYRAVTLEEARRQIQLSPDARDHDDELVRLILAATKIVQDETKLEYAAGTYQLNLDQFPLPSFPIRLLRNTTAVDSISYLDSTGTPQPMDSADFIFSQNRVWPHVFPAETWPTAETGTPDSVTITYTAGFADQASIPEDYKQEILSLVDTLWSRCDHANFGPVYQALANRQVATYL